MCHFGDTKGPKYGMPIFFGETQESLSATVYTSTKLVSKSFGFVHNSVMLLHEMNKYESLSTTSYAFVVLLQLYMSFLSKTCYFTYLSKS